MTDLIGLMARCEKDLDKAGVKEWVTIRQDDLRELLHLARYSPLSKAERMLDWAGYEEVRQAYNAGAKAWAAEHLQQQHDIAQPRGIGLPPVVDGRWGTWDEVRERDPDDPRLTPDP